SFSSSICLIVIMGVLLIEIIKAVCNRGLSPTVPGCPSSFFSRACYPPFETLKKIVSMKYDLSFSLHAIMITYKLTKSKPKNLPCILS
ncbi:MAG: hypothetical protein ACOYOS_24445, partial [Syntrophales bacterium]